VTRRRCHRAREHRVRSVGCGISGLPPSQLRCRAVTLGDHARARRRGPAATHVRSFLKPGGRMAISSWDPPDRVPFLAIPMRTAMQRLKFPPRRREQPVRSSRPTPEALGGLLEAAGVLGRSRCGGRGHFQWQSPEEFQPLSSGRFAPPIPAMIAPHPQEGGRARPGPPLTEAIREGDRR